MIVITILGWVFAAIIFVLILGGMYVRIVDWKYEFINSIKEKGVQEYYQYNRQHVHWLNSPERKPFRDFYEYIMKQVEEGRINPKEMRDEVDRIIKEGEELRSRANKS